LPFKCNLQRYSTEEVRVLRQFLVKADALTAELQSKLTDCGGALHVESS
jgi:hypothetical protein